MLCQNAGACTNSYGVIFQKMKIFKNRCLKSSVFHLQECPEPNRCQLNRN